MTENGYLNSFVEDRESKKEYRDSGFTDDYDNEESRNSEHIVPEPQVHNGKINSFNISSSTDQFTEKEKSNSIKFFTLNELICIINILSSTLGGGAFVFPYIIYEVGILTSLFIFIFVSITVYYSLDLLRRFVVDSKLFSFSHIVQATLGNLWQKIYGISSFLFYMSCIVNYLVFLFKYMESMVDFFREGWGKFLFFSISYIIEVVLCIFTNKVSKIHYLSLIVVSLFFIILIVLIIKSIILFNSGDFQSFSLFTIKDKNNKFTTWTSFLYINAKIIEFFYGFIYHSSFPTLLSVLDNISNNNTKKIQFFSYLLLIIIYIIFSFFGCGFYDEKSDLLFENNIDISNNVLEYMFKCILILFFLNLIPIRYIVIRDNYTSIMRVENLPLKYEILITAICLFITNLIVYLTGERDSFISQLTHYFGGALGVFISFVLPVLSYIFINGKTKLRAIFGYIIVSMFIFIGFFSIFYNFQSEDDGMSV